MERLCGVCETKFEAQRSTAKYCSSTCRQRAKRGKTSAAKTPDPNSGLVSAVRAELVEANRLDTVAGQLAIELAKQVTAAGATGIAGLSKQLLQVRAEALAGWTPKGKGKAAAPVKDEVDEARKRREQKARQAASRA